MIVEKECHLSLSSLYLITSCSTLCYIHKKLSCSAAILHSSPSVSRYSFSLNFIFLFTTLARKEDDVVRCRQYVTVHSVPRRSMLLTFSALTRSSVSRSQNTKGSDLRRLPFSPTRTKDVSERMARNVLGACEARRGQEMGGNPFEGGLSDDRK